MAPGRGIKSHHGGTEKFHGGKINLFQQFSTAFFFLRVLFSVSSVSSVSPW